MHLVSVLQFARVCNVLYVFQCCRLTAELQSVLYVSDVSGQSMQAVPFGKNVGRDAMMVQVDFWIWQKWNDAVGDVKFEVLRICESAGHGAS